MNREEQILAAAKQQYVRKGYTRDAFIAGAQWADENRWINILDELPPEDEYVFVNTDAALTVARYDTGEKEWFDYYTDNPLLSKILFWMPIPELPEVE